MDGKDVFLLLLSPGPEDREKDRNFRDVAQFRRDIDADWAKRKVEVIHGPAGWLPEADGLR